MSAPDTFRQAWGRLPALARLNAGLLLGLAAALSAWLLPQWRSNPDLAHGLFLPLVFVLLVAEGRTRGSRRYLRDGGRQRAAVAVAASLALLALALAGLYAAVLGWDHALVEVLLCAALSALCLATLFAAAAESCRFAPLNWPTLCAAGIWLSGAPIPPGTYQHLTLALQGEVTRGVLVALHLFGIPAIRIGNVLQLASTQVGIEEACSGVRSLISCGFTAVFFSATLVTRWRRRVFLIVLAVPLALATNFVRSLALTLIANAGGTLPQFWHDAMGYSVLVVTAILLGLTALALETRGAPPARAPAAPTPHHRRAAGGQVIVSAALAATIVLAVLFVRNTRPAAAGAKPAPDLWAALPAQAAGWSTVTTNDVNQFAGILQSRGLAQRSYLRAGPPGEGGRSAQPDEITLFVAYWAPGDAPVSLVASHTPDACWPGGGWIAEPLADRTVDLGAPGRPLPAAEQRRFRNAAGWEENVWFWQLNAGQVVPYRNPYSLSALLRIAWKYGFRHEGDQYFIRVSSNRPWAEIAANPAVTAFLAHASAWGLARGAASDREALTASLTPAPRSGHAPSRAFASLVHR